jgi:hypothetical protein
LPVIHRYAVLLATYVLQAISRQLYLVPLAHIATMLLALLNHVQQALIVLLPLRLQFHARLAIIAKPIHLFITVALLHRTALLAQFLHYHAQQAVIVLLVVVNQFHVRQGTTAKLIHLYIMVVLLDRTVRRVRAARYRVPLDSIVQFFQPAPSFAQAMLHAQLIHQLRLAVVRM